jgi:hypothetical protein
MENEEKFNTDHLKGVTTGAMIKELMARGALRGYGANEYVPGIVQERFAQGMDELRRYVQARQVDSLARSLVNENIVDFTERRVADTDPSAPPNDLIFGVELLTLDPKADMGGLG